MTPTPSPSVFERVVEQKAAHLEEVKATAEREIASVTASIHTMLKNCSNDQLLAWAEECGAEVGPDHCWRCQAWHFYVERTG